MKSRVLPMIFMFLASGLGQAAPAAEFGGYVALTSDYVKRGVSQSDGDPSIQLSGDLSFDNGFYIGAWGSSVDIQNGPSRKRDVEINYYLGYAMDISSTWQMSVGAVAYTYPGQTGNVDYNYEEYSLGASFDDRMWLEFAYSPDLYNTGQSSTNIDVFAEWPIDGIWSLGAGAGRYDTSDLTGRAYSYWQLGATASLSWADIDFRFHDTDRAVPIISTPERAKSRFVVKIQIPF
ncbi:MAG: TorF family putative porin [Woeseiaceae bacterium]